MPTCHRGRCCAFFKEKVMRSWVLALPFVCLPFGAEAQSVHAIQLVNDTKSQIVSFAVSPAGGDRDAKVDFTNRSFYYGDAVNIELHDNEGCLRDFRTLTSDGRTIVARNFNVCTMHAYRPGVRFRHGLPGAPFLP
jgi:hypothetical protein